MPQHLIEKIQNDFTAYYQPIVDLNTEAVAGFEVLTRFRGSDGGVQSANDIIDQIEQDIEALTLLIRQLLLAVSRDAAPLFERYPDFFISINIPPVILGTGHIRTIIDELQLELNLTRIVAEVTERQALTEMGRDGLAQARSLGARIAIDDFGTGHSGIEQITGLDFDILKINHSLIAQALKSSSGSRLLRGIVALATALKTRTIAEGIETRDEALFLRGAGADCGQGWFWSKALPAQEIEQVLQKGLHHGSGIYERRLRTSGRQRSFEH